MDHLSRFLRKLQKSQNKQGNLRRSPVVLSNTRVSTCLGGLGQESESWRASLTPDMFGLRYWLKGLKIVIRSLHTLIEWEAALLSNVLLQYQLGCTGYWCLNFVLDPIRIFTFVKTTKVWNHSMDHGLLASWSSCPSCFFLSNTLSGRTLRSLVELLQSFCRSMAAPHFRLAMLGTMYCN